jgi:hypothetical protein
MVKAVAAGGGRGLRPVTSEAELAEAMRRCVSEATAAFGNALAAKPPITRNSRDRQRQRQHAMNREVQASRAERISAIPVYAGTSSPRWCLSASGCPVPSTQAPCALGASSPARRGKWSRQTRPGLFPRAACQEGSLAGSSPSSTID